MEELMLKVDNVSKIYKLGQIGGTTLRDEIQRKHAKLRGEEDPTKKIGAKDYVAGETFSALAGVTFEVKKGERVGIIGHNGAGKSTLLKLISRVTSPTSGEIGLNGRVASMLEVGTGFHAELTGRENIYMNGAILGMTEKEIDAKLEDIIEFSECRQFIDTPVKRYSSGMYVKLAFSVAAHLDSEIMIMDEVLAVGDMAFQKKCLNKMKNVSEEANRTIIYVSHNMNTIRELCDRCIVLSHGKLIYDGNVEQGIYIYSNISNGLSTYVDFSTLERDIKNIRKPLARMLSLETVNRKDVCYKSTEELILKLKWEAIDAFQNARIRTIFNSADGRSMGLTLSDTSIVAQKGVKYDTVLKYDLSTFVTGIYSIGVYITEITTSGQVINYDAMDNAFTFEIVNSKVPLDFVGHSWGSQYFPEAITNTLKAID